MTDERTKKIIEEWANRHRGSRNAHRVQVMEDELTGAKPCVWCGGKGTIQLTFQHRALRHQDVCPSPLRTHHEFHVCGPCFDLTREEPEEPGLICTMYRCPWCLPLTTAEWAAVVLERARLGMPRPPGRDTGRLTAP